MTSEPKFVPEEAVEITPDGTTKLSVRMIDSVGYMVDGAVGATEDGVPRMVTTPWFDYEIPMTDAAELGTKKVMQEHCTIGLVVTTDGTVTDIPRQDYIEAERRAIEDMQKTGKPYLVLINSQNPGGEEAKAVQTYIRENFGTEAMIADCQSLDREDMADLLKNIVYSFPMQKLCVHLPRWMDALENDHPVKKQLYGALLDNFGQIQTLSQADAVLHSLKDIDGVQDYSLRDWLWVVGCSSRCADK